MARLDCPHARLFEDTQVCMVWSGHASIGEAMDFEQPRYGRLRRVESSVDNFTTLPLLVVGTQRVATLHRRLARHFARQLPVRVIEAPFDMPPLVETIAWPRRVENDPAHAWLRQTLADCAAAMDEQAMIEA